ncbi:hypothetical protein U8P71_25950 (plasmid) [Rhizobium ruizarguesonis]|nr:hypothetical protein U8P71_25950 [Rhizobium ruizarguesonis]
MADVPHRLLVESDDKVVWLQTGLAATEPSVTTTTRTPRPSGSSPSRRRREGRGQYGWYGERPVRRPVRRTPRETPLSFGWRDRSEGRLGLQW